MKKVEIDAREIEVRTLAYMTEDADRMEEDDTFKRRSDIDLRKLGNAISRKDSGNIPVEGVVKPVDFHKTRAAELFACKPENVTEAQRRFAKAYYFGELYENPQTFGEFLKSRGLPKPIRED